MVSKDIKYSIMKHHHEKKWFGIIDIENKSYYVECPFKTRVRSEAIKWLREQANKYGGVLSIANVIE